MKRETYLQPSVELVECLVEQGFAASTVEGKVDGFDREDWNE